MISENNKPLPETKVNTPVYDRAYFRNKTLDEYPNLYREFSSENFDYYGITDETLCGVSRETICPLCKLGHDDEEIEAVIVSAKPQAPDFKPITFEARPDPELIIKSVLEHFPYLKFRNSFRGNDNYNFASPQPWSSPCPICNGKHGNYGLHGEWYRENENQLPYDPELAKLYSQDKLEYCLTCNTS
ncbi:3363_t:CDS:2, partial [Racocetra fulgida]